MKIVSNRFSILCVALGLALFLTHQSQAQVVASDVASNYSSGVSAGTTGGTGFGPWAIATSGSGGYSGFFTGDPASGEMTGLPNPSFGLYAHSGTGTSVRAMRPFSNALSVGQTFSVKLAVNWDSQNGNKGIRLLSGGTNGTQIANIQHGGFPGNMTFQGASNTTAAVAISDAGYGTGPMTWSFTLSNATTLRVSSTARNGSTNVVFTTNIAVSAIPDAVEFYASNLQADNDRRQPYFNNLQISQGDGRPPTVTLSNTLVALQVGTDYTASVASATDDFDGLITTISNNSATILTSTARNTPGTYTVTYSATDVANNTGTATQTVVVHAAGAFASQYSSVAAPGLFNGWANDGSRQNRLFKYENFKWRLLYYFDAAAGTNAPYLITANNEYAIKWGVGGARGAGNASLNPTVDAAGWYVFDLNELTDSASLAKLPATPDVESDGIPDVWESFFGQQLASPLTDLVPGTIYNDTVGGTKTAKQAYDDGENPVADVVSPTISLAAGVLKFSLVATNTSVTLSTNQVTASDNVTANTNLLYEIKVDGSPFDPTADTFNTTTNTFRTVVYNVFDQAGNMGSVERVIAVGDPEPGWRKLQGPATNTISTIGSATIYGRIFIAGVTSGAGQAANITAELGVNSANTDPSTWTTPGVWRAATYNLGVTGGDDEYQATVNGSDLTAGTYFYAYRFKIGDGVWRYAGMNAAGTDGGPWDSTNGNGTLVVNQAQVRNVTFAVNMGVQRELGNFNPDSDKVYLVGEVTDWGTGVEMVREGTTDVFKLTRQIEGALGTNLNYKFKSGAAGAANGGYEDDQDPVAPNDQPRVLTLAAVDNPQLLTEVFFNNVSQVRSLTFKVDMGVQITKGLFAHGDPIQVRFGDFNATNRSLTREGSTTIYSGTYAVAGNAGSAFEYKFWRTNSATNTTFEQVDTNALVNRSYSLGSNGVAVTLSPTPFFSNDDGVGPVITLTGANPLNLANGATWTDPGATAADVAEGTSTSITGTGDVNTLLAGEYTVTYSASDAAGNAGTAVTRTVIVAAAPSGSTFASWRGTNAATPELLTQYAFGAFSPSNAVNRSNLPTGGVNGSNLVLTYHVRADANNANLVVPQLSGNLADTNSWNTNGITHSEVATNTVDGVSVVRKTASVPIDSTNRKFLRLKIAE